MICAVRERQEVSSARGLMCIILQKIKSDINKETNNPRHLRCSRTSVQVDRATDFPSTSKKFGKGNQKMTRFCRVECRQTDGETLFLYFLLSR
jgi:hypothetical protein